MAMKITPIDMEDKPKRPAGASGSLSALAVASLAIGALALLCIEFTDLGATLLGAAGLLVGGYAMNMGYRYGGEKRNLYAVLAAVGLILAVFAFMLGFLNLVA